MLLLPGRNNNEGLIMNQLRKVQKALHVAKMVIASEEKTLLIVQHCRLSLMPLPMVIARVTEHCISPILRASMVPDKVWRMDKPEIDKRRYRRYVTRHMKAIKGRLKQW